MLKKENYIALNCAFDISRKTQISNLINLLTSII